jgi:HicA toxin of bacterial toxin-antitoxin,
LLLLLLHESKPTTFNKTFGGKRLFAKKNYRQPSYIFHPDLRKTVVVPVHGKKDIPNGTFLSIIKQAGISKEDI